MNESSGIHTLHDRWKDLNHFDVCVLQLLPQAEDPMMQRSLGSAVVGAAKNGN
jgi:hypothetical protein